MKQKEIVRYVIAGLATTAVSYATRFGVLGLFLALASINLKSTDTQTGIARTCAVTAGWVSGVLFAYFSNKRWVFQDKTKEKKAVFFQFTKFVASRIGTYFVELGIGVIVPAILVNITTHADLVSAGISIVVVTILNYVLSKIFVFKEKEENNGEKA